MLVRVTHREPLLCVDLYHAFEQCLTVGGNKMGHVEQPTLHLLQELTQVVVVKWQRALEGEGE